MKKIVCSLFGLMMSLHQVFAQDWVKELSAPLSRNTTQIQALHDGDLIVCGATGPKILYSTQTAMLTRLHPDGTTVWAKQLGSTDPDGNFTHEERLEDLALTADGHIITVGYRNIIMGGPFFQTDVLVVKTDLDGNLIWKKYLDWSPSDNGMGIAALADGGIAICGNDLNSTTGGYEAFVLKMDAEGTILWKKEFNLSAQEDWLYKIIQTDDHNLVAVGTSQLPGAGNRMLAVKLDQNGNTIWQNTYDGQAIVGRSVVEMSGGHLGFGGTGYQSPGGLDNLILETDADGNVFWERNYHIGSSEVPDDGYDLLPCAEGGYVAVGMSGLNPFDGYNVLHVNAYGMPQQTVTLFDGGNTIEWAVSLAHTPDGAIMVAGNRLIQGGGYELILSKYSSLGCSAAGAVPTETVSAPLVELYPNPADEILVVKAEGLSGRASQFSLSDVAGRPVLSMQADTDFFQVPCRNLSNGIYFYSISTAGGEIFSGKIAVKH